MLLSNFEVRVGDADVAAAAAADNDRAKICLNALCSRWGHVPAVSQTGRAADCVRPTRGRYVTVQHYRRTPSASKLVIAEIDVILYCGVPPPDPSQQGCPMAGEEGGGSPEPDECALQEATGSQPTFL